jgi:hypothetical protein
MRDELFDKRVLTPLGKGRSDAIQMQRWDCCPSY